MYAKQPTSNQLRLVHVTKQQINAKELKTNEHVISYISLKKTLVPP